MPSHYAHHRFGTGLLAGLDPQTRRTVHRFRQLYEAGLQGPDIFFYHSLFLSGKYTALARALHGKSGTEFFGAVCALLRQEPSEGAQAYLTGLLAHYCLDSVMHPLVLEKTQDGAISHAELETEFDRYLLQLDGKRQPNTFDLSPHIRLTPGECKTVAALYPEAGEAAVRLAVRGMARWLRVLAMPNGNARRIVEWGAGEKLRKHFMGRSPNKNCAHLNEELLEAYRKAQETFPAQFAALQAHISGEEPLGELFEATFDG